MYPVPPKPARDSWTDGDEAEAEGTLPGWRPITPQTPEAQRSRPVPAGLLIGKYAGPTFHPQPMLPWMTGGNNDCRCEQCGNVINYAIAFHCDVSPDYDCCKSCFLSGGGRAPTNRPAYGPGAPPRLNYARPLPMAVAVPSASVGDAAVVPMPNNARSGYLGTKVLDMA